MPAAIFVALALAMWPGASCAGEWTLRLGELRLEGISVDEQVAGSRFHLSLASETAWFTFTFPASSGRRPSLARAENVDLNGFDPYIRCTGVGGNGLLLDGFELRGEVVCSEPAGTLELVGNFEN